jgi:hypothetical protein
MSSANEVTQRVSSAGALIMMMPLVTAGDRRERTVRAIEASVVVVLVAAGFGIRLWWALTISPEQVSDARGYAYAALEIAAGNGYHEASLPTAYYPVGYSAALALFHRAFGSDIAVARIANAVFGAGTLFGLYVVARALTQSRVAAALTLLAFAVYPADIAYTSITLSQPAFNTFALLGVALCVYSRAPASGSLILGAALLGWATLTRNQGVALAGLLALAWSLQRERRKHALLLTAAFVAAIAPWTIRNALAFDAFVPVSNNGGINLYIGNNPSARGRYKFSPQMDAKLTASTSGPRRGGPNEVAVDRLAARLALAWVTEQPRAALELWKPKFEYLYGDDEAPFGYWSKRVPNAGQAARIQTAKQLNRPYYPLLLWLGAAGACLAGWELCTRRKRLDTLLWFPAAVIALFTALHMLTFGDPCYHHPMLPWFALYAGFAAATPWRYRAFLTHAWHPRRYRKPTAMITSHF